jgi:hypothetical protein
LGKLKKTIMEETTQTTPLRPTFLTVLCILTFLGSGWGIIDAAIDYMGADVAGDAVELVEESMDEALEEIDDDDNLTDSQKEKIEGLVGGLTDSVTPENIRSSALVSILASILTLIGALLMWNLRQVGYYVYIGGTLVLVVGLAMVFGGLVGALAAGASGFIGVLFIVLYGLNLKHMN